MTTRLESYMDQMLEGNVTAHAGFLGAYNMGVWGLSVSGRPPLEQGLLVAGKVLKAAPKWNNKRTFSKNFVKYYDTPDLWGFGDKGDDALYNAITHACSVLDISRDGDLGESQRGRVKAFLQEHYGMDWDGRLGKPWSEVGKKREIQYEMDQVGAWSNLVSRWKAVIAQSRYLVDITSLSPPVTGHEAQIAICTGVSQCVKNWASAAKKNPKNAPRLMIRLMFGMTAANMYGTGQNTYWNALYSELQTKLQAIRGLVLETGVEAMPVVLYGSDMGKKISTFNHSKIVAGDGQYAIVGGHNMCEEVSSNTAPVIHDVTAEVTGPGALSANAFAGSLWLKAAESGRLYIHRFNWTKNKLEDLSTESTKRWAPKNSWYYELGSQKEVPGVLKNQLWYYPMETLPTKPKVKAPRGSVPATAIMGVGRWGDTKVFSEEGTGLKLNATIPPAHACQYASDHVKRLMINDPSNTLIRMSQQDLINAGTFGSMQASEHTICDILGKRLKRTPKGTAIQVVVSSRFAQNSEGLAYSYGDGPREAAERISDSVVGAGHASSDKEKWPDRLAALDLKASVEDVPICVVESPSDPSFCTVAPLAFCEARGTTRDRGSYVWPDVSYVKSTAGKAYQSGRFWNKLDKAELSFGPGNHAKVMIVSRGNRDSTGLVMIGSDNMYPSPLSEFNFVIEGAEAVRLFRMQYWDKLWGYSARFGFTVDSKGMVS